MGLRSLDRDGVKEEIRKWASQVIGQQRFDYRSVTAVEIISGTSSSARRA